MTSVLYIACNCACGSSDNLETYCMQKSLAVKVNWTHTACGCWWYWEKPQTCSTFQGVAGIMETLPATSGGSLLSIFCHVIQMNQIRSSPLQPASDLTFCLKMAPAVNRQLILQCQLVLVSYHYWRNRQRE